MLRNICIMIIALLLQSLMLTGCKNTNKIPVAVNGQPGKTVQPVKNTVISLWTYAAGMEFAVGVFRLFNEDIEVKLETFTYDESVEKYSEALASGTGPDLLILDSSYFGRYSETEAFQDLLEEPFSAGNYKKDFPYSLWDSNLSIDGKRLLALPLTTVPQVTFYREDIMRQNGFPSDPDELGKFIESPRNWLEIAKKLKKNDQYIIQWSNDPTEIMGTSIGFFDRDLNFLRNSDLFRKGLDIEKEAHKLTLEANTDLWSEVGQAAVSSGKLAMLYLGSWGTDIIQRCAPDTNGKWRVTRLPFGIYGWSGSTIIAMNSQSEHKDAAWKLMEFLITHEDNAENTNTIPAYIPARKNPVDMDRPNEFLGGQKAYAFYEKLADRMKEYTLTPLDDSAREIFKREIIAASQNNTDSDVILKKIAGIIDSSLGEQKKFLLQYMGK